MYLKWAKNKQRQIRGGKMGAMTRTKKIDILMIDNYDSFTFNLVQYLGILGENIKVRRNDKITLGEIKKMSPSKIVISPGPGRPEDAGISKEIIKHFYKEIPILGVCLGHQCIGEVFGAKVVNSGVVVHGKTSKIYHDGRGIFEGIRNPFDAARYHSLILKRDTILSVLEVTAHTEDGIVMGVRHREFRLEGVQFHPESFLTETGLKVLKNFINL
jgi:anthranilate synthase/aminodeoxychorismate synthase-like glutamine amidotransferase